MNYEDIHKKKHTGSRLSNIFKADLKCTLKVEGCSGMKSD